MRIANLRFMQPGMVVLHQGAALGFLQQMGAITRPLLISATIAFTI